MSNTLISRDLADPELERSGTGPPGSRAVRTTLGRRLLTFAMVMGPGLIVMVADNDAGAVSTYTEAGAKYGANLLWVLALLLPCTYFVQEMVARLGIVTGQGHAALIYRRFGKSWGTFSVTNLLIVNFLTLVTEFACISLAMSQLGVSPFISVPVSGLGLLAIALTGSYRRWERVTLLFCALNLGWILLAFRLGPSVEGIAHGLTPNVPLGGISTSYVFLVIAIVGTTIAPWQLYFQQSCVADKRLRFSDLKWARLDTFIGALVVITIAGCMMLVGSAVYHAKLPYTDPAQMAGVLSGLSGPLSGKLVLLLMVNAALVGATTISLSSAWAYGEVKGWAHSLQLKPKDAPGFYGVYVLCVAAAAGIVLIPNAPLQLIILSVQVLAGIMLPSAMVFLQLLLNDRQLLGDDYVNKPWNNVVNWIIVVVLFGLSLVLAAQVLAPGLFPK